MPSQYLFRLAHKCPQAVRLPVVKLHEEEAGVELEAEALYVSVQMTPDLKSKLSKKMLSQLRLYQT